MPALYSGDALYAGRIWGRTSRGGAGQRTGDSADDPGRDGLSGIERGRSLASSGGALNGR
jgi:hypothetical protein